MLWFSIIAIALLLLIFFYLRGEGFRKELFLSKRQLLGASNNAKELNEIVLKLSEERWQRLQTELTEAKRIGCSDVQLAKLTDILVQGAMIVIADSLKQHHSIHDSVKRHLAAASDVSFDDFKAFLAKQPGPVQQAWLKNSLPHFLQLCHLLLQTMKGQH